MKHCFSGAPLALLESLLALGWVPGGRGLLAAFLVPRAVTFLVVRRDPEKLRALAAPLRRGTRMQEELELTV